MPTLYQRLPAPHLPHGTCSCTCADPAPDAATKLIVLTGGPGAGKTAVLHAARATFCCHVAAVPEAASILFTGGFPRHETLPGRAAAQRAIFHVQREGERLVEDEHGSHAALCDRGTVDGAAYWPGTEDEYWEQFATDRAAELARYAMVVHLQPPTDGASYVQTATRIEDAALAHAIDERIMDAWRDHPNRIVVPARASFEEKLSTTLDVIKRSLPATTYTGV